MLKNYSGGTILTYGPELPTTAFDGSLFYKTTGNDQGLFVFSFKQDGDSLVIGDQVKQDWFPVKSSGLYVDKTGDVMSGPLEVGGTLKVTSTTGTQRILMGPRQQAPLVIDASSGSIQIGTGTDWSDGGTFTPGLTIDPVNGISVGTGAVWHGDNDGAGSGMDADLLDGKEGSEYLDKATFVIDPLSSTPKLKESVLPFQPVEQTGVDKIRIGWSAPSNRLQVQVGTAAAGDWPINIMGSATSASTANTATLAATATNSDNARFVRSGGTASGTPLTFNNQIASGTPAFMWGSQDRVTSGMYSAANITVGNATTANQLKRTDGVSMTFNYSSPSGQPTSIWGTTDGVNVHAWDVSAFIAKTAETTAGVNATVSDTNQTYLVPFLSGAGTGQPLSVDADFSYNPSTNVLRVTTVDGTALRANYADLAEIYSTDAEYPIGTVMVVNPLGRSEVTASNEYGARVVGVISEFPAFLMNKDAAGQPVALKGKVPVRVVGPVLKGQYLGSGTNGTAVAQTFNAPREFAVALETNLDEDEKLVMCIVL